MFENILLPLDGSLLAESVLPMAGYIAMETGAHISFVHVIEQNAPKSIHQDHHLTNANDANLYLSEVSQRPIFQSIDRNIHVHSAEVNNIARSIVSHARDEYRHDLIILCAHGNSGMRDFFYGSIAQQVVSLSEVPVMVVKPSQKDGDVSLKNILVPLDNESLHDDVIPFSEGFSRYFGSTITLLCVIPTLSKLSGEQAPAKSFMPSATSAYLDIAEEIALEHFQDHVQDYKGKGINAISEISRGDPAKEIINNTQKGLVDLVIMGTHGSAGWDAFWNRSVTATVARQIQTPLLLIPLS